MRLLAPIAVLALAALAWWLWRDDDATTPQAPLPFVYQATEVEWIPFYDVHRPAGTGWVLEAGPAEPPYDAGTRGRDVVPAAVCGECHAENHAGWLETVHASTSREGTRDAVLGSFEAEHATLTTRDPDLWFEMTADDTGMYQAAVVRHDGAQHVFRQRIDLVTGSGHHGQSYLYWKGGLLHQLPVSYFTGLESWTNSPGVYIDGTADFARPIGERCLDCHATFFAKDPQHYHRYDRSHYVLGVSCVRCHGPGKAHVEHHRAHPDDTKAHAIVNPASLSRERTNDVCAQCHSGGGRLKQPAFSYVPGTPLADYIELDHTERPHDDDPHAANQLARLRRSRCFKENDTLSCATCHDPHTFERGDGATFSKRCQQCHEPTQCNLHERVGAQIGTLCVACHMPTRGDSHTAIQTSQGLVLPKLRDHFIKHWPEATRKVLERIGK